MTFCLGMRVKDGLVGIADTRVTSGNEVIQARKVSVYHQDGGGMFLMTSGLRSVRDKALTYFDELIESQERPFSRLFKAVNAFSEQLRRVAAEDREALGAGGLNFDIHCIIGGRMPGDKEHTLYLVYPEGNWVEIGKGTPYQIIGASGYGKPILDRTLAYEDPISFALKVGCLAFDSTRISAADVNFPIDVVIFRNENSQIVEHRYDRNELGHISDWWDDQLRNSIKMLPSEWIETVMSKLVPA
ncbi:MAG: peptidase [Deltaproteobacteria bacterium]|nr:MAG: peptidase [Deltaproteobacteria bacterium]